MTHLERDIFPQLSIAPRELEFEKQTLVTTPGSIAKRRLLGRPAAAIPPAACLLFRPQHFGEAVKQPRGAKNLGQQQKRPARVRRLGNGHERALQLRIGGKRPGPGKQPRIHFRVHGPQFRLQSRRVSFGIVHKKSRIDAEEARQEITRLVRQVRPGAAFDLREVRLAQAAPNLALHGGSQLLLGERAAQTAKRTLDRTQGAKFVAKFHERLRDIAICKYYIAICYFVKRNRYSSSSS